MRILGGLSCIALSMALAQQDFAFNLESLQRPGNLRDARRLNDDAFIQQQHRIPVHRFPQSSFRSFKVIGEGRVRTFKQTTGDMTQGAEELVYLAPASESKDAQSETNVEDATEAGVGVDDKVVLEAIRENVGSAFDEYIAPILQLPGSVIEQINGAALAALDWLSSRIWGKPPAAAARGKDISSRQTKSLQKRLAILKIDSNTGDVMIVKSPSVSVKIIRIDRLVYDASEASLAERHGLTVGMYRFEPGDFVLSASSKFFESVSMEQIFQALSASNKLLASKADALVKAAPRTTTEESFLLSIFE